MDNQHILERIEKGNLKFEDEFDDLKVQLEIEAADTLGMLLRSVRFTSSRRPANVEAALRKQSASLVDRLNFLDELKVIEVDGMDNAVQIRSVKPSAEGFIEVILRGGSFISFERRGAPLHISKKNFDRLLTGISKTLS